jgi:fibronectin-binding autotransporter adhesin
MCEREGIGQRRDSRAASRWAAARCWLGLAVSAASLIGHATPARAQLTTGLQSYFDFQSSTISNVVAGASGYTPSITNTGSPQSGFTGSASRPLLVGNALNLIRSENDYFSISNIGSGASTPGGGLNLAGSFTLSAWHYLDLPQGTSTGTNRYYVWEGTADYDVSWGTGGTTTGPDNYTAYATTASARTVSLPRNTWNNIVQVFSNDGTNITSNLYINGQFIGSNTTALSNMNWAGLRYGNSRGGGGRAWNGTIDEIGIWNTSLTAAEAQEVYIRGLQGTGLTATTTGVGSWSGFAATAEWTASGNWSGGAVIGGTGAGAASSNAVAIFGDYSLASGLGIDMSTGTADGSLGLGAIVLDSTSGTLRIGNSSATDNGVLQLNGAATGAGANTLLYVTGSSDLVIANSPDALNPGSTTLGVTLGIANGTISVGTGRTVTIESAIGEATAASGITKVGNGTLVLSGTNTYTGGTTVSAGALVLASTAAAPAGGTITVADAAGLGLAVGGSGGFTTSDFLDLFAGTFPGVSLGANSTAGIDTTAGDATLTGDLAGVRGLAKFGANTLTVTGDNSYSGATTVFAGTLAIGDGGTSGTLPGNAAVTGTLAFDRADDVTYSSTISGTGAMVKRGAGTLTLTGASTYTGGTTVAAGTLAFGTGGSTGTSGTVTVQSGATLRFDRNDTWGNQSTAATPIVTIDAGGTVQSNNFYTTLINPVFNGGTLQANDGVNANFPTFGLRGTVAVNATAGGSQITSSGVGDFNTVAIGTGSAGGTTTFNVADGAAAADLTVAAPLTNLGGVASNLVKSGAGTMAVTAASRYTGTTTINAGTLAIGTGGSLYATGAFFGGTGATNVFVNTGGTLETRSWVYGSDAALSQLRDNSYSVRINGGTVRFTDSTSATRGFQVGAAGATLEAANGVTYTKLAGTTASENIIQGQGTGGGGTLTLTGAGNGTIEDPLGSYGTWSAAAGVTKTGTGTWTLAATNVYTGATTVSAGTLAGNTAGAFGRGTTTVAAGATLQVAHAQALRDTMLTRVVGDGTVDFAAGTTTYAIAGLTGPADLDAGGNTLAIGGTDMSSTYGGNLTAAALVKQGTGTLTLAGASTLSGTTLSAGTLAIKSNTALGTGPLTISAGRLRTDPSIALANAITLSGEASSITLDMAAPAVEYLVVGGGGGGDNTISGVVYGSGGGGGQVQQGSVGDLAAGSYTVTVGTGGTSPGGNQPTAGEASAAFGITAAGGQPGSSASQGQGGASGSGFAGGTRSSFAPGGGGGAGGAGGNGNSTAPRRGGAGGVGVSSSITGSAVAYGGGGGGNEFTSNIPGAGGDGGGGAGGQPGIANTGGGGGGDRAGGSGIVIVRYQGDPVATGGTVTAGTGSAAGYTLHTFTEVGDATLAFTGLATTLSGDIDGTGGFTWTPPARSRSPAPIPTPAARSSRPARSPPAAPPPSAAARSRCPAARRSTSAASRSPIRSPTTVARSSGPATTTAPRRSRATPRSKVPSAARCRSTTAASAASAARSAAGSRSPPAGSPNSTTRRASAAGPSLSPTASYGPTARPT